MTGRELVFSLNEFRSVEDGVHAGVMKELAEGILVDIIAQDLQVMGDRQGSRGLEKSQYSTLL